MHILCIKKIDHIDHIVETESRAQILGAENNWLDIVAWCLKQRPNLRQFEHNVYAQNQLYSNCTITSWVKIAAILKTVLNRGLFFGWLATHGSPKLTARVTKRGTHGVVLPKDILISPSPGEIRSPC